MKTEKPQATKIKIKNARLSYPHIFEPQMMKGATKAKYSADLILDKTEHKEVIAQIEKEIERTALDFFKKKVHLKHTCLHDGNEREDKEGYGDEKMFIVAKNDRRFPVVDQDPSIPLNKDSGKPYGGCYVVAIIRLFAYDHPTGGKGVSASLELIQFLKHGEAFGAGTLDPEEELDDVSGADDDKAFD